MKYLLISILTLATIYSCSKHKGDIEEYIPTAGIVFSNPVPNTVYHPGDTVFIKGTAISTAVIHGYDIAIRKVNDTTTLFFINKHDHNDTLQINQSWKNELVQPASLEATVTLYLDHEHHTYTRKLGFRVE